MICPLAHEIAGEFRVTAVPRKQKFERRNDPRVEVQAGHVFNTAGVYFYREHYKLGRMIGSWRGDFTGKTREEAIEKFKRLNKAK
jgi:hypothetical protein